MHNSNIVFIFVSIQSHKTTDTMTTIELLIEDYEKKVSNIDESIKLKTKQIRDIRREISKNESGCYTSCDYHDATQDFAEERRILDARRQSYIQIIQDLKSLQS